MIESSIAAFLIYCGLTIAIYQGFAWLQNKTALIWLNPMMLTMIVIIPLLLLNNISFEAYYQHTQVFSHLLEPAIVVLGYPLYQQINVIKAQFAKVMTVLATAIVIMLCVNFLAAIYLFQQSDIAVSLALKSITTPIGLALTEQFQGVAAITAVGIIIAGLVGGIWGLKILPVFGVTCKKSQGLAIGCASHALGTATISPISYQHGAFASLSLILSALITAVFSPIILPPLMTLMTAL